MNSWKRKGYRFLAIIAAVMLCINTFGCISFGAEKAGVKYVWKNNDPSSGIRTGIQSIYYDDVITMTWSRVKAIYKLTLIM